MKRNPYQRRTVQVFPCPEKGSSTWRVRIGKKLTKDKSKLVPKDFYFPRTNETNAKAKAEKISNDWNRLVSNWKTHYQTELEMVGNPFPEVPQWLDKMTIGIPLSDEDIEKQINRPLEDDPDPSEILDKTTLESIHQSFILEIDNRQADKAIKASTANTLKRELRGALKYYPSTEPFKNLDTKDFKDAKSKLISTLGRRTAKNYVLSIKKMLLWFYDTTYGTYFKRFGNFNDCFLVPNAGNKDIVFYSKDEITTFFELLKADKAFNDHQRNQLRLCVLMGLNCGMIQGDLQAMTAEQLDLSEGSVYWRRQKEPTNPKAYHLLSPITIKAIKDHWKPNILNANTIGNWMTKFNEHHKTKYQFHNFRKSGGKFLRLYIQKHADKTQPIAIKEISDLFLNHFIKELDNYYDDFPKETFAPMNHWLTKLWDDELSKIIV